MPCRMSRTRYVIIVVYDYVSAVQEHLLLGPGRHRGNPQRSDPGSYQAPILMTVSVLGRSDLVGVGYESIVSERVRWQLRSLMHHNECCNAENSKV